MTVEYGKLWANTSSQSLLVVVDSGKHTLSTSLPQSDGSASPEDASFSQGGCAEVGWMGGRGGGGVDIDKK